MSNPQGSDSQTETTFFQMAKLESAFAGETLRHKQAQLYLDMLNSVKSETFPSVSKLDKRIANSPVTIKTSPHCSCGRFFEQHPTFIEDMDEVNVEIFLHSIVNGHCKCLNLLDDVQEVGLQEVGKHFIHVAATLGSLTLMRQLMKEADSDINVTTFAFHYTPLSLAVMQTRAELVKWLCDQPNIQMNIKSKSEKHTPLLDAMLAEKFHLVEMLTQAKGVDLNAKNFRKETPLIVAVRMQNVRLVRQLLLAGADYTIPTSNGVTPLMLAINAGHEVVQEFIKAKVPLNLVDAHGETALTKSVRQKTLEVTNVLIRGGANPRANPALPAFILAADLGYLRTLAYFIDIGQDVNQTDDQGWTALHFACCAGYTLIVEALLSCGANPDGSDHCKTSPLGLAVFHRHIGIAKLLLDRECEVNRFDDDLDTPLHFATASGDQDAVQLLLDHGCTVCVYNGIGATPLFNGLMSNNTSIIKCLLPYYIDLDLNTQSQGFKYLEANTKSILFTDCSRSILWIAANNASEIIIIMLLNAGFDASKEEWIHDRQFPVSLQSNEQFALRELLIASASTPMTLLCLSRCAVRRALGPGKQRNANGLNIPRKMKNFIMLRDAET